MGMSVTGGATNVTTYFVMRLAADGTAATALTITDFDLQYVRSGVAPAAKADATSLAATDSAHGDNQAIEIDATDQPGLYRVDWPDAAFAAGVPEVILSVKCATCFTEHLRVLIDQPVDVTKVSGDSTAADNLELDYDGTGYAKANSTIGTCTTNTDLVTAAAVRTEMDSNSTQLAAIVADTNELQGDWTDAGRLDTILDAILTDTGTTLPLSLPAALTKGTADSGSTTTCVDAARTEADTDYWAGSYIRFSTGLAAGQTRLITGFTPASDTITFAPATTGAVASTDAYEILPGVFDDVRYWGGTAPNALVAGRVDASAGKIAAAAITASVFAADAVDAAALASDAVDEIVDQVWDELTAGHVTASTFGKAVGDVLADTNELQADWADGGRLDLIVDAVLVDTAQIGTATGASIAADIAALNDIAVADILTTQMTESYAANGTAPTLAEALFAIHQCLMQFTISTTSYTVKKLDNSTTAFVGTLDDATSPTSLVRS